MGAMAVDENVALMLVPCTVARTVFVPALAPRVYVIWARPWALVVEVALPSAPPPASTVQATVTPERESPAAFATRTTSGWARALLTPPVWEFPLTTEMDAGVVSGVGLGSVESLEHAAAMENVAAVTSERTIGRARVMRASGEKGAETSDIPGGRECVAAWVE